MSTPDFAKMEATLHDRLLALADQRGKGGLALARTDPLIDRGVFDSLSLLDFVVFTEKLCGIKIPGEDVHPENFGSLETIMRYLHERM